MKYASIEAVWQSEGAYYLRQFVWLMCISTHFTGISNAKSIAIETRDCHSVGLSNPFTPTRICGYINCSNLSLNTSTVGRDGLFRLLRDHGLLIVSRKRGYHTISSVSQSHHGFSRCSPGLCCRHTYLQTLDGFVYLADYRPIFTENRWL